MKVCLPIIGLDGMNDMVAQHFGLRPTFTVVDIETDKIGIIANTCENMGE
jgi:predicted Fe-Mo cluster-binding NifX family protein